MVFSSPIFLFVFLPLFFGLYFLLPVAVRNGWILLSSIVFYALGAGPFTLIPLALVALNWGMGHLMQLGPRKPLLWLGIALNLTPLLLFKYSGFFVRVASDVTGLQFDVGKLGLILPLGISFYSFHFISYLVDVYHGHLKPERSIAKFAIYIFLFPHLVAGPIVRYSEIHSQLPNQRRSVASNEVFWGLILFIVGLSKKILIADPLGAVVDGVHNDPLQLTTYSAWLSAFCYSFQIYFDFSGYTDMAIGMAAMMGFHFPQNFNRPYTATSITEFWRRWHMTLSRWFRDYVYIPLGGNRGGAHETYLNLVIVFVLCGLWHGAAYTFLIWGLAHGLLLVLERARILRTDSLPGASLLTFLMVTVLWVPFRSKDLDTTVQFAKAMVGMSPGWSDANRMLASPKVMFLLLVASLVCLVSQASYERAKAWVARPMLAPACCLVVYLLACISVVESGFNPFIYFQF